MTFPYKIIINNIFVYNSVQLLWYDAKMPKKILKSCFSGYNWIKKEVKSTCDLIYEISFSEVKVGLISIEICSAGICINFKHLRKAAINNTSGNVARVINLKLVFTD